MSETRTIESLYLQTKIELASRNQKNAELSIELDRMQVDIRQMEGVLSGRLEELNAGRDELKAMEGILSKDHIDEIIGEIDSEIRKLSNDVKKEIDEKKKQAELKLQEINTLRGEIRALLGKMNVHTRILKRLGSSTPSG